MYVYACVLFLILLYSNNDDGDNDDDTDNDDYDDNDNTCEIKYKRVIHMIYKIHLKTVIIYILLFNFKYY